jgi:hypothetical protein
MEGLTMAFIPARNAPGQKDVNDEFSAKNILDTLKNFKALGANYRFGDLTVKHLGLDKGGMATWRNLVDENYPAEVQEVLKTVIVQALTHKDANGYAKPIPIKWVWSGKSGTVKVTFRPTRYKIELGFAAPLEMRLAQRRERAKGKK